MAIGLADGIPVTVVYTDRAEAGDEAEKVAIGLYYEPARDLDFFSRASGQSRELRSPSSLYVFRECSNSRHLIRSRFAGLCFPDDVWPPAA